MEWYTIGGLLFGLVLFLMAIGVPVAFAFLGASIIGVLLFMGGVNGLNLLAANATSAVTTFSLVPIPMFLLMGALFFHSGLAVRVFDAIDHLLGRLPGRLSYLTVIGGTIFATLSGSSMANTAMLGSLLVPQMESRGYKRHMSMGPVVGIGALAMIIPPSALAVLLGSLGGIDIGALLIAGVVPGFLLAAMYLAMIFIQVKIDPAAAPSYQVGETSLKKKIGLVVFDLMPMGLVVFCVVGLIILGIATPSEAAAFGVLGVVILALIFRRLTLRVIVKSLESTLIVSVMVLLIIVGSATFSQLIAFSGVSTGLIRWVTEANLPPSVLLLAMLLVVLFLGMLMDSVSIMMLTLPIYIPLAESLGIDLIWFGMLLLLCLETSLMTPPLRHGSVRDDGGGAQGHDHVAGIVVGRALYHRQSAADRGACCLPGNCDLPAEPDERLTYPPKCDFPPRGPEKHAAWSCVDCRTLFHSKFTVAKYSEKSYCDLQVILNAGAGGIPRIEEPGSIEWTKCRNRAGRCSTVCRRKWWSCST